MNSTSLSFPPDATCVTCWPLLVSYTTTVPRSSFFIVAKYRPSPDSARSAFRSASPIASVAVFVPSLSENTSLPTTTTGAVVGANVTGALRPTGMLIPPAPHSPSAAPAGFFASAPHSTSPAAGFFAG